MRFNGTTDLSLDLMEWRLIYNGDFSLNANVAAKVVPAVCHRSPIVVHGVQSTAVEIACLALAANLLNLVDGVTERFKNFFYDGRLLVAVVFGETFLLHTRRNTIFFFWCVCFAGGSLCSS